MLIIKIISYIINIFQEDLKAEIANLQIDNQKLKVDIV